MHDTLALNSYPKSASKFVSKSTHKSTFKLTTYIKFKSTVYMVVLVFTSTYCDLYLKWQCSEFFKYFQYFVLKLHGFASFGGCCHFGNFKFYFKNTLCVLN